MHDDCTTALENAEAFLGALAPTARTWRDPSPRWVFRGHGDATWGLVPSVLRTRNGKPPPWVTRGFPPQTGAFDPANINERLRHEREVQLVMNFRQLADRAGLVIPEDSARLRSWRQIADIVGASPSAAAGAGLPLTPRHRWPPAEFLTAVALAQHYRVPTRLLDWSWKPRVAAYFAARDVMENKWNGSLAVWALNIDLIDQGWVRQTQDPDVEIVHAPQASNPNLGAQAGVFTVARCIHENVGLETLLEAKATEMNAPLGVLLRKLTLPTTEARSLMARLALEDVSAATVFPGYAGVAEAMHETEWWWGAT